MDGWDGCVWEGGWVDGWKYECVVASCMCPFLISAICWADRLVYGCNMSQRVILLIKMYIAKEAHTHIYNNLIQPVSLFGNSLYRIRCLLRSTA